MKINKINKKGFEYSFYLVLTILVLFLSISLFTNFKPTITGIVSKSDQTTYSQNLNIITNENLVYDLIMDSKLKINSLKINGRFEGLGYSKIYLEDKGIKYLIYDSSVTEKSNLITGLTIANNEINQNININLDYGTEPKFDENNDGIEKKEGIIDLTVDKTSFNWDVNESNLCTRYDTYSDETDESTIVCYGSTICCNFINMQPTRSQWDQPFYSNIGRFGATENNQISAQVIYVDYSESHSNIFYSEWQSVQVKFSDIQKIEFKDSCAETCVLGNFDSLNYKIIIEINDGTLYLDNVTYTSNKKKSEEKFDANFAIKNSKGKEIDSEIEIIDKNNKITKLNKKTLQNIEKGKHKVNVNFNNKKIKKIELEDVDIKSNIDEFVKIDYIEKEKADEYSINQESKFNIGGNSIPGDFNEVFAIDPSSINFSTGKVTVTATSNTLYKCKDWNFTQQKCLGSWTKLKRIIPGQDYTIEISPEDPGFGEINITYASHLDENYNFISDIFDQVKTQDEIWSEPIYHNEYVRIIFETNLTSENDITIFPRNNLSLNTKVEVYHFNSTEKITSFPIINESRYFKKLLTGMNGSHDTFDLKIINTNSNPNAFLEFDHITDPTCTDNDGDGFNITVVAPCGIEDCDDTNASILPPYENMVLYNDTILCNGVYNITDSSLPQGIIIINASNITLNCNNSLISGNHTSGNEGIWLANQNNVTIENCGFVYLGGGIHIEGSNYSLIRNNSFNYGAYGIDLKHSYNNTIINNTIIFNSQDGIRIRIGTHNNISNNLVLYHNGSDDVGIYLEDNYNYVLFNNASYNYWNIELDGSDFSVISHNIVYNSSSGGSGIVNWDGSNTTIFNNTLFGNQDYGIYVRNGGSVNITKNTVTYTVGTDYYGIYIDDSAATIDGNNVSYNSLNIYINDKNTVVKNNQVFGAFTQGGIYIDDSSNLIINNTVMYNHDHGIQIYDDGGIVVNNTISNNNKSGIFIDFVDDYNITNNDISHNKISGMNISDRSEGFRLKNNTYNNNSIDIYFSDTFGINIIDEFPNAYVINESGIDYNITEFGKIAWEYNISANGTNFSKDVFIISNNITINSSNSPGLNVTANLSFLGITVSIPNALKDGSDCGSICENSTYDTDANLYTMNVSHFTSYSVGEDGNSAPTITSAILNATDHPTNSTNANLTIYTTGVSDSNGDNVTLTYNWLKNGSSISVLSLPFDFFQNGTWNMTHDFSSLDNHGNVTNATFNTTGGIIGGAFEFNGNSSLIFVEGKKINISTAFTIETWLKPKFKWINSGPQVIQVGKSGNYVTIDMLLRQSTSSSGHIEFHLNDYSTDVFSGNQNIPNDQWTYVAITYNKSTINFYVNGSILNSTNFTDDINWTNQPISIGFYGNQTGEYFDSYNGTLDELKIYNITLTSEQILANYNNGYPKSNLTVSQETKSSENWSCMVWPIDSQGLNGSGIRCNNVTISDSTDNPPAWFNNISNNTAPKRYDFVNFSVNWTDDNALSFYIFSENFSGTWNNNTNGTLSGTQSNVSVLKNVTTAFPNTICWRMYVNDSTNQFNNTDEFCFAMSNTEPIIDSLILNATDNPSNLTTANLTIYSNYSDRDGDNVTITYNWLKNGSSITVLNMPFDKYEDSANNVNKTHDFSENENNGNLSGEPIFNNSGGIKGGAYHFQGNRNHIKIEGLLGKPASITIEVWADSHSVTSTSGREIISIGDYVGIRLDAPIDSAGNRTYGFFYGGNDTWPRTSTGLNYSGTGWHHYVYTINNDTYIQKFYVDGELLAQTNHNYSINYSGINDSTFIGITADGSITQDFNGTIDELKIYNITLTSEQILANYNNGYPKSNLTVSQETTKGETWSCTAWPIDQNGLNGSKVLCNNITLLANLPTINSLLTNPTYVLNGTIVNITANITSINIIDTVIATLDYPNGTFIINLTLKNDSTNIFFNDSYTVLFYPHGTYNITLFVNDTKGNINNTAINYLAPYINLSQNYTITINGSFQDWAGLFNFTDPLGDGISIVNGISVDNFTFFGEFFGNDEFDSGLFDSDTGDFNNDGFPDLIWGAGEAEGGCLEGTQNNCGSGMVYLWNTTSNNFTFFGEFFGVSASDNAGYSLAVADFNNDTYDDFVLGAGQAEGGCLGGVQDDCGSGVVYLWNTTSNNFTFFGEFFGKDQNDKMGLEGMATTDFNNDGYYDFIMGNGDSEGGCLGGVQDDCGSAVIYLWNTSSNNFTFFGEYFVVTNDDQGAEAIAIADFNNDTFDDFVLGASSAEGNCIGVEGLGCGSGVVYLWNTTSNNFTFLGEFFGSDAADFAGKSVSTGDFNKDGFPDMILGGTGSEGSCLNSSDNNNCGSGFVYLWNTTSNNFTFFGEFFGVGDSDGVGDYVGVTDFNNDNFSDFIIGGESGYGNCLGDTLAKNCGSSVIYLWNTTSNNFTFFGEYFGVDADDQTTSIAIADFNNDSFDDFALGAWNSEGGCLGIEGDYCSSAVIYLWTLPTNNTNFDFEQVSLANNNTHFSIFLALNNTNTFDLSKVNFRAFISTNNTGSNTTPNTNNLLPYNYRYWINLNSTGCILFNHTNESVGNCEYNNNSYQLELSFNMSDTEYLINNTINISFEALNLTDTFDFVPDRLSFISYNVRLVSIIAPSTTSNPEPTGGSGPNINPLPPCIDCKCGNNQKVCDDGSIITCQNKCVGDSCNSCDLECPEVGCKNKKDCGQTSKTCPDGTQIYCENTCKSGYCSTCDLTCPEINCNGVYCIDSTFLCEDGSIKTCTNSCNPISGECSDCDPQELCFSECNNVNCEQNKKLCNDGTTAICENTCQEGGICEDCTPSCPEDPCYDISCFENGIICPDGSISTCENSCDSDSGICSDCIPKSCSCKEKECGNKKITCPDGSIVKCKNSCNSYTGECSPCSIEENCPNLCKGKNCQSKIEICQDGSSRSCTPICDPISGNCGDCVVDCTCQEGNCLSCDNIFCQDITVTCQDGTKKSCTPKCSTYTGECDECDPCEGNLCDGVSCQENSITCPDGKISSCNNACNSNNGKCSDCTPICSPLCEGYFCNEISKTCEDGTIASCKPTCNPLDGECTTCEPICPPPCEDVSCSDNSITCPDGRFVTCPNSCQDNDCTNCDPLELCDPCIGTTCNNNQKLCQDGTLATCENNYQQPDCDCSKCTPSCPEDKCFGVSCSQFQKECDDGSISTCINSCDQITGDCLSCTPACKNDICYDVNCQENQITCQDGSTANCQNNCNPQTGTCSDCKPEIACPDNPCYGISCQDKTKICSDGSIAVCESNCENGICNDCTPTCQEDPCNGITCQDSTIICNDGFERSCTNKCNNNDASCSECNPINSCPENPCYGITCQEKTKICSDGSIAVCESNCENGICNDCTPTCQEDPCNGITCLSSTETCPDGIERSCTNKCNNNDASCSECDPCGENPCVGITCQQTSVICLDGIERTCNPKCDQGECGSCDPCNKCYQVSCSINEKVCSDGSTATCLNSCEESNGQCSSCVPTCQDDLCYGQTCFQNSATCDDGTIVTCEKTCDPQTGECTDCDPDNNCPNNPCYGIKCQESEEICEDGTKATCPNDCENGDCSNCKPSCGEINTKQIKNPTKIQSITCINITHKTSREEIRAYNISDFTKIPKDFEKILDPFGFDCKGDSFDLTINIPNNIDKVQLLRCRGKDCKQEFVESVEETNCGEAILGPKRDNDFVDPKSLSFYIEETEFNLVDFKEAELDNLNVKFVGDFNKGQNAMIQSNGPVKESLNPDLKIISTVIIEINEGSKSKLELNIPYLKTFDIPEESLKIYYLSEDNWRLLGGSVNKKKRIVKYNIENIDKLLNSDNKIQFAVIGVICDYCENSKFKKIYEPTYKVKDAVLLVHGLASTPDTFKRLIDDITTSNQPYKVFTYAYPSSNSVIENAEKLSEFLNQHQNEFENLHIVSHSLGGLIVQKALQESHQNKDPYIDKLRKVILIGVPNQGTEAISTFESILRQLIEQNEKLFTISESTIDDLKNGIDISPIPGKSYYIIAGTKLYDFQKLYPKEIIQKLIGRFKKADGLVNVESAFTLGEEILNDPCENYWEIHLTHTDLIKNAVARTIINRIIGQEKIEQGLDLTLGSTRYYKLGINNCNSKDQFMVIGKKSTPKDITGCACGDGVCGQKEDTINCPTDCQLFSKRSLNWLWLLLFLIPLLFLRKDKHKVIINPPIKNFRRITSQIINRKSNIKDKWTILKEQHKETVLKIFNLKKSQKFPKKQILTHPIRQKLPLFESKKIPVSNANTKKLENLQSQLSNIDSKIANISNPRSILPIFGSKSQEKSTKPINEKKPKKPTKKFLRLKDKLSLLEKKLNKLSKPIITSKLTEKPKNNINKLNKDIINIDRQISSLSQSNHHKKQVLIKRTRNHKSNIPKYKDNILNELVNLKVETYSKNLEKINQKILNNKKATPKIFTTKKVSRPLKKYPQKINRLQLTRIKLANQKFNQDLTVLDRKLQETNRGHIKSRPKDLKNQPTKEPYFKPISKAKKLKINSKIIKYDDLIDKIDNKLQNTSVKPNSRLILRKRPIIKKIPRTKVIKSNIKDYSNDLSKIKSMIKSSNPLNSRLGNKLSQDKKTIEKILQKLSRK